MTGLLQLVHRTTKSERLGEKRCANTLILRAIYADDTIASGGNFARTAGFAVSLVSAGTRTIGIVRCEQPRAVDLKARADKKLEAVPDAIIDEVLAKLAPLFE